MKVDLPGGWADLRDRDEVTERLRRPVVRQQRRYASTGIGQLLAQLGQKKITEEQFDVEIREMTSRIDDMEVSDDLGDAILGCLVKETSFGGDPLDLPADAFAVLKLECNKQWAVVSGMVTDEDVTDPESPTGPASV